MLMRTRWLWHNSYQPLKGPRFLGGMSAKQLTAYLTGQRLCKMNLYLRVRLSKWSSGAAQCSELINQVYLPDLCPSWCLRCPTAIVREKKMTWFEYIGGVFFSKYNGCKLKIKRWRCSLKTPREKHRCHDPPPPQKGPHYKTGKICDFAFNINEITWRRTAFKIC